MAGFRYVIASTLTVQVIMKHNATTLNNKLKQRTESLLSKNREDLEYQYKQKKKEEKEKKKET